MYSVSSCCCCISLRKGTLIWAWWSLIGACLHLLGTVRHLWNTDYPVYLVSRIIPNCEAAYCLETTSKFVLGFCIAGLFQDVVITFGSVLLIYGVNKNRPKLMTPFLMNTAIGMFITTLVILVVGITILVLVLDKPVTFIGVIIGLVSALICIAIQLHFYFAIKSFQTELMEALNNPEVGGSVSYNAKIAIHVITTDQPAMYR